MEYERHFIASMPFLFVSYFFFSLSIRYFIFINDIFRKLVLMFSLLFVVPSALAELYILISAVIPIRPEWIGDGIATLNKIYTIKPSMPVLLMILFLIMLVKEKLEKQIKVSTIVLLSIPVVFLLLNRCLYRSFDCNVTLDNYFPSVRYFLEQFLYGLLFLSLMPVLLWDDVIKGKYYLYMGNLYYRRQELVKALEYYEELIETPHFRLVPYKKLKEFYLKQNRKDQKALKVYEKSYEENPNDKEVVLALAEIYASGVKK